MCWIWCKCNQNLERNTRTAASINIKSGIAGSIAEGDDMYNLHGAGVGMCSNELEGVAFASSRTVTNLSSHGHALLQVQRFGIEINFVA